VARPFVWLHGYAAIAESADDARQLAQTLGCPGGLASDR